MKNVYRSTIKFKKTPNSQHSHDTLNTDRYHNANTFGHKKAFYCH